MNLYHKAYMKGKKKHSSKKMNLMQYGSILFVVGILISLVASAITFSSPTANKVIFVTLAVLGLLIGFLNVTNSESVPFLIGTIALVLLLGPFLGSFVQALQIQAAFLQKFFSNIIALIVPAAIVVALKVIIITAKDE